MTPRWALEWQNYFLKLYFFGLFFTFATFWCSALFSKTSDRGLRGEEVRPLHNILLPLVSAPPPLSSTFKLLSPLSYAFYCTLLWTGCICKHPVVTPSCPPRDLTLNIHPFHLYFLPTPPIFNSQVRPRVTWIKPCRTNGLFYSIFRPPFSRHHFL